MKPTSEVLVDQRSGQQATNRPTDPLATVPGHLFTHWLAHWVAHWVAHWGMHVGAVTAVATLGGIWAGLASTSIVLLAATAYVCVALVGDPRLSWPFWIGTFVVLGLAQSLGLEPLLGVPALLLPALLWWALRRRRGLLPDGRALALQVAALAGFAALAAVAVLLGPVAGVRLGGVALILHSGWDAWHLIRRRSVAASAAEFCLALDLVLGTLLLLAPTGP